jgi:VWFA-related protein
MKLPDICMNTVGRMTRFAVCLLLFSLVVDSQTSLQERKASAKPLQYDITVALKLIQVYVTDKAGMPVRDLTKDDFEVTDNGRRMIITDFEKHILQMQVPAPSTPVAEPKPETVPPFAAPMLEPIRRHFIIFFDFAWNTPRGVAAGIKAALDFLDTKVAPGDDAALASYSAIKGLRIHESLTTDKAKIRKAVAGLTAKEISGRAEEVEQAYWLLAEAGAEKELRENWENQRRDSARQASEYFRALTRLAQSLRLVNGQKNILFFSNGVPSSLVNVTRTAGNDSYSGSPGTARGSRFLVGNSELRPLQEAMLKEFRASDCSFYAFDTRESSKIPSLFISDEIQSQTRIMVERDVYRDEKTTGMDSLRTLAKETGGQYYANILRYAKNLEEVTAVTGTYYVLGYSLSQTADGKFHDVKVEVKRKGCQVRRQPGYFNPKPFSEYSALEKDLQLFDLALNARAETATEKPFSISAISYEIGRVARIQALARIPKDLWEDLKGRSAELVAVFFDANDELLSLQRAVIAPADFAGKDVLFSVAARARPGTIVCRVIIRDLETGRSEVVSAKTYSVTPTGQALTLFSPLLLVQGGGLYQLEGVVKGGPAGPSWRAVYVFDASALTPVVGGEPAVAGKIMAIVPFTTPSLAPADLTFRMNLVDSTTGQDLPISFQLRERAVRAGLQVQDFEISLEGVPLGSYRLYIHGVDKATGAQASTHGPLVVSR